MSNDTSLITQLIQPMQQANIRTSCFLQRIHQITFLISFVALYKHQHFNQASTTYNNFKAKEMIPIQLPIWYKQYTCSASIVTKTNTGILFI